MVIHNLLLKSSSPPLGKGRGGHDLSLFWAKKGVIVMVEEVPLVFVQHVHLQGKALVHGGERVVVTLPSLTHI